MPKTLKVVTVWLLIATALFLAVQAWLAERGRARFQAVDMRTVELQRGLDGHFHWPARINGVAVDMLVDTGATRTALPGALASRLGLQSERSVQSSTAGGVVRGYESTVDLALENGPRVDRLRVTVLPDLQAPLLGMDVLSRLHFSQQGGVLRFEPAP